MLRREFLIGTLALTAFPTSGFAFPDALIVNRTETCGCCGAWVERMNSAGLKTEVNYVDEEALDQFVPCDRGSTGHADIFRELAIYLPEIKKRLEAREIPGFFLDLEPHLRGGGQFGGYSGPDGMGVALRSLCHVLDEQGLSYQLKTFEEL